MIGKPISINQDHQFDEHPTQGSSNLLDSNAIHYALQNIDIQTDSALSSTSANPVQNKVIKAALDNKANKSDTYTRAEIDSALQNIDIQTDSALSSTSANPVQNKVIKAALDNKANKSDTYTRAEIDSALQNIDIQTDRMLSSISENPVQNKVIKAALDGKQDWLDFDMAPTQNSMNPVTSHGVWNALRNVSVAVDSELSSTSTNPLQNRALYNVLSQIEEMIADLEDRIEEASNPPIISGDNLILSGNAAIVSNDYLILNKATIVNDFAVL